MTLLEIQNFCAAKVGINDSTTLAQAGTFAKARWKMIWDKANWRQARIDDTLTIAANTQDVTLPSGFEFATRARWAANGIDLPGTEDETVYLENPAGYAQPGSVLKFSPMPKDSSGNAIIRLQAPPLVGDSLYVVGKKKCPQLVNPTDTPLISGVDTALCAFVMNDLLQWLRQYGKAQIHLQEATTALQLMEDIEIKQTQSIHRFIPIEQVLDGQDY